MGHHSLSPLSPLLLPPSVFPSISSWVVLSLHFTTTWATFFGFSELPLLLSSLSHHFSVSFVLSFRNRAFLRLLRASSIDLSSVDGRLFGQPFDFVVCEPIDEKRWPMSIDAVVPRVYLHMKVTDRLKERQLKLVALGRSFGTRRRQLAAQRLSMGRLPDFTPVNGRQGRQSQEEKALLLFWVLMFLYGKGFSALFSSLAALGRGSCCYQKPLKR